MNRINDRINKCIKPTELCNAQHDYVVHNVFVREITNEHGS